MISSRSKLRKAWSTCTLIAALGSWASPIYGETGDQGSASEYEKRIEADYVDIRKEHEGRPCHLVREEGAITDDPGFDPNADPEEIENRAPAAAYRPLETTIYEVCGGLGCIDDPASDDPSSGICGAPVSPDDCAGVGLSTEAPGFCDEPHLDNHEGVLRAKRFMFTAGLLADLVNEVPDSSVELDITAGLLFQLALTMSRNGSLPRGGRFHYDLPRFYLHVELLGSKQRIGGDLGLVYKFNHDVFTRAGLTAFAQTWGVKTFVDLETLHVGPAVHFELLNNLLVRVAAPWWGPGEAPQLIGLITYSSQLWGDFK